MSKLALEQLTRRQRAMMPGGPRDRAVRLARFGFPAAAGLLLAALVILPLSRATELSFLLSKDKAGIAGERMRIIAARYKGTTLAGEPFEIAAASAVQKTSTVPVVVLQELSARIERDDGPASVTAPAGLYHLDTDLLEVSGPVQARGGNGYRLDGQRILVDIAKAEVTSAQPVSGEMPIGSFAAGRFEADLRGRRILLDGGVSLRIRGRA
jgi:lipopolysaccharide export system protein LptC